MLMIGIDIGTTNSKVGIFDASGRMLSQASRQTQLYVHGDASTYFDPLRIWADVAGMIKETAAKVDAARIVSIGITSMAESGLLLDRSTGKPITEIVPWSDTSSAPQAKLLEAEDDPFARFLASGLQPSYKLSLAKILWLKQRDPTVLRNAVWLSVAGYIAYRLTGVMAFDYTLAARTYAFDIRTRTWDKEWLGHLKLPLDLFPEAFPSGHVIGHVSGAAAHLDLPRSAVVCIGGHDHLCASLAVEALNPGDVYNSMGTAETLVGVMEERELHSRDYDSKLAFGLHPVEGRMFWMGSNSASGGSVEWIRSVMGLPHLTYDALEQEVLDCGQGPTGILYYPFLAGSGPPKPDAEAKAAFIGLTQGHSRGHLFKAVLEGTSYQMERVRETAAGLLEAPMERIRVTGGGTRLAPWLRIKAALSGRSLEVPEIREASLMGAALLSGAGSGVYSSPQEAATHANIARRTKSIPFREKEHSAYRDIYESQYIPISHHLRLRK
ncbi:FGGY-family carbohydrate kinase [Paenibacillus lautus]|jgi:sugar (pentulose or hexulose) kinase|uniref:FGGY-family carbohydrate kinase n=1 Tax=Paenibacillus lautus TaxID=1401 RepID=UPI000FDB20B4|nr:FGGY-family carbohydrate kinase [Paenibacillus lautus]